MSDVRWESWSSRTFDRAVREDKPVLLSISAVWCHWCHVMDDTTYSHPEVAAAINERFVPVRVDNDLRPDVNARYNMGGWPTTAFLTPDGMTITGGTYLPPEQMLKALDEISRFYSTNKAAIAERAEELRGVRRTYEPAHSEDLQAESIARVIEGLAAAYDTEYGGFGTEMKFPQADGLEMLLLEYRVNRDPRLLEMVSNTLQHMAGGGTYDHEEGGFFRYSTTRDWSIPHFEKMAEDHAGLLRALAELRGVQDDAWIEKTLKSASGYVRTVLRDPKTGFFAGSQDADEEYYAKPLAERREMEAPFIDRRSYSNWTAALAGAFFKVSRALNDPEIAQESVAALDAMHERMRDADNLLYHMLPAEGPPAIRGLLGDQVAYVRALLDAHEHTGEQRFLDRAIVHGDLTIALFEASDGGGFYDSARIEEQLGNLVIPDRPIVDNGIFADALLRLAALTGGERYRTIAERTLLLYAKTFDRAGSFGATYVRALRRYLTPETSIRIVGDTAATAALRQAALALPMPLVSIRTVRPSDVASLQLPSTPAPAAYACTGMTCGAPVTNPADLKPTLATLSS